MLSPEVLAKVRQLELQARHKVSDLVAGQYLSAFKGRGMEFDQVRAYTPGDDVRMIDWNVTARMDHPFIKVHREERQLTINLIVDTSPSMFIGSCGRSKLGAACEVAALFAALAVTSGDRVGLIMPQRPRAEALAPRRQQSAIWQVIRTLMQTESARDLASSRQHMPLRIDDAVLRQLCGRRSLIVYVSDFRDAADLRSVQRLASGHELIAVCINDPIEEQIPAAGIFGFEDIESGEVVEVDLSDSEFVAALRRQELDRRSRLTKALRLASGNYLHLQTNEAPIDVLASFLQKRGGAAYGR